MPEDCHGMEKGPKVERFDRIWFDTGRFPVRSQIRTRMADVDMQGHVNNAAAMVILQEARSEFFTRSGLLHLRGNARPLVAGVQVEYAGEIHHPATLCIDTGVMTVGRTSITLAQVAREDGRPRLYAQSALVFAMVGDAVALSDQFRAVCKDYMIESQH